MTAPDSKKQKLIDKIVKMKKLAEGEEDVGNVEAAQNFAAMINRMLVDHQLSLSDVEAAAQKVDDPVIMHKVDIDAGGIAYKKRRVEWQEAIAVMVATHTMCGLLISAKSNMLWFVGTQSNAMAAEFMFVTLARAAEKMSMKASRDYRYELWVKNGRPSTGRANPEPGFRASWLRAFVLRIKERLEDEQRRRADAAGTVDAKNALVRVDRERQRAQDFIGNMTTKNAKPIKSRGEYNTHGETRGRDAANRFEFGRPVQGSVKKEVGA